MASSRVMTKKEAARRRADNIDFNIKLLEATLTHLNFLEEISQNRFLENPKFITYAIKRYEMFWLPLLASQGFKAEPLAAPIDIEWVWHAHMLAPQEYTKDCITVVSRVLDHRVMSKEERVASKQRARDLWDDLYPDENFEVDFEDEQTLRDINSPYQTPFVSRIFYDLRSALERQRVFNYQVSLPHYRSLKFLEWASVRYRRFLFLNVRNPGETLVPCFDIALIWHVHLLHPHMYRDDTTALLGKVLPHDDKQFMRQITDRFKEALECTSSLWQNTYGGEYNCRGTSYRGDPPTDIQQYDVSSFKTDYFILVIEKLSLRAPPLADDFILSMRFLDDSKLSGKRFRRRGLVIEWENKTHDDLTMFAFRESKNPMLQFKLKMIKLLGSETIGMMIVPVTTFMDKTSNSHLIEYTAMLMDHKSRHSGIKLDLAFRILPDIGLTKMKVRSGAFSMSEAESMYGFGGKDDPRRQSVRASSRTDLNAVSPSSFQMRQMSDGGTKAAVHAVINQLHQRVFTVRVFHKTTYDAARIEILDHDGYMVALSETIDPHVLPSYKQILDTEVEERCTLETGENERAMMIRGSRSDWGICRGKWTSSGGKGHDGHHGNMKPMFLFFGLSKKMERKRTLLERSGHVFRLANVLTLDLEHGKLRIKCPDLSDAANVVALAFSVALLPIMTSPCREISCQDKKSLLHKIIELPMVTLSGYD
ncbi:uncharacterized protein LOC100370003 [Saccoglossus kowalevskii]|uniref:Uncharacterized protein LOC100370003 n=1 Tax=Saccoglossus kowalevskii TaxID=10224 RepID=A0ABM0GJR8_SACKO|nr:PREDICTED: uncharacterized protein LOC100370003 [Saccoglossus kowalevskii]